MRRTSRGEVTNKKSPRSNNLAQFGLFDIPGVEDFNPQSGFDDDDEDDGDLEDELNMILSGPSRPPPKPKPRGKDMVNLDAMVAASLKDEPSDVSDDDGDEDDPSLLAELNMFTGEGEEATQDPTPVMTPTPAAVVATSAPASGGQAIDVITTLKERTELYMKAEAAAKENGETAKARRLKRGLDQLKKLLITAERGGHVEESDIPLPVTISTKKEPPPESESLPESGTNEPAHIPESPSASSPDSPAPEPVAPVAEDSTPDYGILKMLAERKGEYMKSAIAAKTRGDRETALAHIKVIKQFDVVIEAVKNGKEVDLSSMPGPPVDSVASSPPPVPPRQSPHPSPVSVQPAQPEPAVEISPPPQSSEPVTIMEALEARLAKYKEQMEAAKASNNSRKERMMGRIVKQYEDAIRLHRAGNQIPVDELPTPPGFPPIPVESKAPPSAPDTHISPPKQDLPSKPPAPSPQPGVASSTSPQLTGKETRNEKQLLILEHKQKQFMRSALKAKQAGDLVQAKEYLRQAKRFDALIEASRSGLPIDMDTLPQLPSKSTSLDSFEVVTITDCLPGSTSEIFDRLIADLKKQIEMCIETRNNFKATGDIANANRYENMLLEMKRSYDVVKSAKLNNKPVPSFKYEKRHFSVIRCNPDMNDNELELSVIQGINFNVPNPKEIDTYVKIEFPSTSEEPKRFKTSTVYNTNNPQYKATFMVPIQRNSKSFVRLFKRQAVKMEVWSKGYAFDSCFWPLHLCCQCGFLRSDSMVATAQVKLQPLETKCTIHDAFDIMVGRKPLGGKLEVKLRVRTPMITKQLEQIEEKWLVIE